MRNEEYGYSGIQLYMHSKKTSPSIWVDGPASYTCARNVWTTIGWVAIANEWHWIAIKNYGFFQIQRDGIVGLSVAVPLNNQTVVIGEPADNQIGIRNSGNDLQLKQRITDTPFRAQDVFRLLFE